MSKVWIWFVSLLMCAALTAQDGVKEWLEELRAKTDDADKNLIVKLGDSGDRAAAAGLAELFSAMHTIYMQREVLRGLARLGKADAAAQVALEQLATVAGNTKVSELREAAIDGLGRAGKLGKHYLRQLVEAELPDEIRQMALEKHVALAEAADGDWYRYIWNLKADRRKNAEGDVLPRELHAIRELAFEGLAQWLSEDELIETLRREEDPKIRRRALAVMDERDMPQTADQAQWLLERVDFPGVDRAVAARILVERAPDEAVKSFLSLAKKRDVTQFDLREEMARLLSDMDDEATQKRLAKLIGRGKPHEKAFALYAAVKLQDDKVDKAIRKQLRDRDLEVRAAAAKVLAVRGDKEALPDLRAMLDKPRDPADVRLAVDAITAIEASPKWFEELMTLVRHEDRDVRNAAVEHLAAAKKAKHLQAVLEALQHDDWSTRLTAIHGLAEMRQKDAVPALIARLDQESGRLRRSVADALWQLTGQPFEEDAAQWKGWWEAEGKDFRVIRASELEEKEREREQRRLQQRTVTGAQFFGIRVESHRVIFIIDCSGSMLEQLVGRTYDGRAAARIDIAKQELTTAIENLEKGALFNVFAFSNGVEKWQDEGIGVDTAQSRAEALEWVDRLGAMGGTNLYDSIELAFADPDVDTIFVLSDGEPTAGKVIDPHGIRTDVAFWNEHRDIKIHTVAVGGNLEVLEWLSKDSGGTHVRIR